MKERKKDEKEGLLESLHQMEKMEVNDYQGSQSFRWMRMKFEKHDIHIRRKGRHQSTIPKVHEK